ncbi:MAG: phosphate ABC transporter substrate-binding protein [Sphingomonadales bacterium BRH_c3]|nr:MAG: phosphate ABC transporter substrate-binding protein [Sphingomonadales bacterium BRH_c3]
MRHFKTTCLIALSTLALAACGESGNSGTRDSIRAVGSSTVFPFAKAVAESFQNTNPNLKSPLIESTGTGGGMKLFCSGIGASTPDVTNASRRMKLSEFETCQKNGVTEIIEMQIGLDGLVFASKAGGLTMNLSPKIVYEALAANPYGEPQAAKTWADVDPSLPNEPILVYGPPSTSGTRDSLKELILEKGCQSDPAMKTLKETDEDKYDQVCTEVRSDGSYVDQGEQDNLIVQKLTGNSKAVGVFGYSFLEENLGKVQGLPMNGVAPTYENVVSGAYPGAREMFIYTKKAHLGVIPGLKEFLVEWTQSWGPGGRLAKIGLIISPEDKLTKYEKVAKEAIVMTADELK